MWDMFGNSLRLFLKGKLFREPLAVLRQWAIGFAIALAAIVLLVIAGVHTGVAVAVVSVGVGGLQPLLFKNLKYA
jgi:hypothetical protein